MPVPDEVDVIVYQGGLAGLVAGVLLARAGRHVLVVDSEEPVSVEASGFRFEPPHLFWGVGESGIVEQTLAGVGLDLCFLRADPPLQVVTLDGRLTLLPPGEALEWEIARVAPDAVGALQNLLARFAQLAPFLVEYPAAQDGWRFFFRARMRRLSRLTLTELARSHTLPPVIAEALAALVDVVFGSTGPAEPTAAQLAAAFHHLRSGFFSLEGGLQGLRGKLVAALLRAGGRRIETSRVRRVRTRPWEVRGVETEEGLVRCRSLIEGSAEGSRIGSVGFRMDRRYLPSEMGPFVALRDGRQRAESAAWPTILLGMGASSDGVMGEEDCLISLRFSRRDPCPVDEMVRVLEEVFPGWSRGIRQVEMGWVSGWSGLGNVTRGGWSLSPRRYRIPPTHPLGGGTAGAIAVGQALARRLLHGQGA